MNAITRWWSKDVSRLIRCFAGSTGGANCRKRANEPVVAVPTRMHLAKMSYACLLYNMLASRQVSRVRQARWKSKVKNDDSIGSHLTRERERSINFCGYRYTFRDQDTT